MQARPRAPEQLCKFQIAVAVDAGIGCRALLVGADKPLHHRLAKTVREIEDIVPHAEPESDAARIRSLPFGLFSLRRQKNGINTHKAYIFSKYYIERIARCQDSRQFCCVCRQNKRRGRAQIV